VENKPRIALLVPGGIGKEDYIPSLLDLISHLSVKFDIHLYSFTRLSIHPALQQCTVSLPSSTGTNNGFLTSLYFLWRLLKDHRVRKFDLIHGFWAANQGIVAVAAGKLLGVKSVVSVLGGDIVYLPSIGYGNMSSFIRRNIITWCLKNADQVAALTRFQEKIMNGNGIACKHLSIVPFGVDTAKFAFAPKAISGPTSFTFIGNLNEVKDPFTLIKVFALLSAKFECKLTIAGSDHLEGEVERYCRSLGVNERIEWKGKIPHDQVPSLLQETDVLLLTSLYEGEAVVVMEAFAAGVIAAGTKVGLLADDGDERVVVMPGDAEGLAAKIEQIIHRPELVHEMQLKNRLLAEKYSLDWTINEYEKIYRELTSEE
jgi:glycosyltransferase involved in cell wall biosynthesis